MTEDLVQERTEGCNLGDAKFWRRRIHQMLTSFNITGLKKAINMEILGPLQERARFGWQRLNNLQILRNSTLCMRKIPLIACTHALGTNLCILEATLN